MTQSPGPTWDGVFAVMTAASSGDQSARVPLPPEPDLADPATRFAVALNLLLDELGARAAAPESEAETRRTSDERVHAMVDSALDAVIAMDTGGRVIEWNDQAAALFGWTRAEVMGRPLVSLIIPERFRDAHRGGLDRYIRTGEGPVLGKHLELAAVDRSGREFPVELSIISVKVPGGTIFSAFLRDISGRVALLRDVRQERERFQRAFERNPSGLTMARMRDRRIVEVNASFLEMIGCERDEVLGRLASEIGFSDPQELREIRSELDRVGVVRGKELRFLTKSGETREIIGSFELSELRGEGVILGSFLDVTDRRTAERRREDLERRQAIIEQVSRSKSEFLANMSHELRTPLNAILGFSDLLLEQLDLKNPQLRYLTNIREAGSHLLELINDVLDISKVEAGKVELRPELIALPALLDPVVESTTAAAAAKRVTFAVERAESPMLVVDPTRVRQILFNLLSNAVKFTPPDGTVRLRVASDDGDLLIDVADSGIGIPAEMHDRVFGVFERLHEGLASAGGTGLGLALTRQLVELHGGSITFDSAPERGTTFHVRLPGVRAEPVLGQRILVVEDERHDSDLVVALAAKTGLRAEVARGLAEARDALRRGEPLGVVIDLRLPDGRGEELLHELRGAGRVPPLPVIVVTVETDPHRMLDLSIDDYLTKPIDRSRLERWLRTLTGD